jgi:hypothetical protein
VNALAYLDGYPDFVSAGAGGSKGGAPAAIIGMIAFIAGPTGFTRGIVGSTDSNFVPADDAATYTALYAQTRFWSSQYWDVASAPLRGEGELFKKMNGTKLSTGFYKYGQTINAKIGVFPAWSTTTRLDCTLEKYQNDACCKAFKDSPACTTDRADYLEQAKFYANSTCVTPGVLEVAPEGSEHGYVYHKTYYQWLIARLLAVLQ